MSKVICTTINNRGHKVRIQARAGKFDVTYNSSGLAWRYVKKGVSEQEARDEFELQAAE